jgi:hypothetical protein
MPSEAVFQQPARKEIRDETSGYGPGYVIDHKRIVNGHVASSFPDSQTLVTNRPRPRREQPVSKHYST